VSVEPVFIVPTPALIARALVGFRQREVTVRYWARRGNVQPFAVLVFDDRIGHAVDSTPLPGILVQGRCASDIDSTHRVDDLRALAAAADPLAVYLDDGGALSFGVAPERIPNPEPVSDFEPAPPPILAPALERVLDFIQHKALSLGRLHASVNDRRSKVMLAVDTESVVVVEVGRITQRWRDGATQKIHVDREPTLEDVQQFIGRL
jgi:hypothetical protein